MSSTDDQSTRGLSFPTPLSLLVSFSHTFPLLSFTHIAWEQGVVVILINNNSFFLPLGFVAGTTHQYICSVKKKRKKEKKKKLILVTIYIKLASLLRLLLAQLQK